MEHRRRHEVLMIAYDGVNLIDISGPLQAFEEANRILNSTCGIPYRLTVASIDGGLVRSGAQLAVLTERLADLTATSFDTLVLPGGSANGQPPDAPAVSDWVRTHASGIGRLCSVCTGAFILADTGLLDDRRATTHWRWANLLHQRHPAISILEDAIFIEDRNIWTSAGVTAGIDLALALIEADHDHHTAISVARELVVYLRRSGGQSQYSAPLAAQEAGRGAFSDLHAWMRENLSGDLRVERLAETVGMSLRTFSRAYSAATATTPSKTVERLRLEAARTAIVETDRPLKDIARTVGLGDEQNLRRLFQRHHGLNPLEYRERFYSSR
ncbi:DJ-1/PfpI family protein [Ochrobactrum sp. Marseille-Q0166]|uniref:GlxA family transcriptional regulator n=1 Tax=Ochrobactrum sp. Marseille-Q0166 TaxID=2761105 RepID=UPI00200051F6|nr:DJ-1/PfpI family protein [Ochrobactrum sp. Marseille-Q0166]